MGICGLTKKALIKEGLTGRKAQFSPKMQVASHNRIRRLLSLPHLCFDGLKKQFGSRESKRENLREWAAQERKSPMWHLKLGRQLIGMGWRRCWLLMRLARSSPRFVALSMKLTPLSRPSSARSPALDLVFYVVFMVDLCHFVARFSELWCSYFSCWID